MAEIEARLVRSALERRPTVRLMTNGTSMSPTIPPGTVITITRRPVGAVATGEIVAYAGAATVVVHRLIEHRGSCLVTLGDNLPLIDPPVPVENYLGVVTGYPLVPPPRSLPDSDERGSMLRTHLVMASWWSAGLDEALRAMADSVATDPSLTVDRTTRRPDPPSGSGPIVVGISARGALSLSDLTALLERNLRPVRILLGWQFGSPTAADPVVLAPESANLHVRAGKYLEDMAPAVELTLVMDALRRAQRHRADGLVTAGHGGGGHA